MARLVSEASEPYVPTGEDSIASRFAFPGAAHAPRVPIGEMPAAMAEVAHHWFTVARYVQFMHATPSFLSVAEGWSHFPDERGFPHPVTSDADLKRRTA